MSTVIHINPSDAVPAFSRFGQYNAFGWEWVIVVLDANDETLLSLKGSTIGRSRRNAIKDAKQKLQRKQKDIAFLAQPAESMLL